jgi:hypothetical protein
VFIDPIKRKRPRHMAPGSRSNRNPVFEVRSDRGRRQDNDGSAGWADDPKADDPKTFDRVPAC